MHLYTTFHLACENIRFSSLFALRMFSQATFHYAAFILKKSLKIHCLHSALCLFLFETNSKNKQVPNYSHT